MLPTLTGCDLPAADAEGAVRQAGLHGTFSVKGIYCTHFSWKSMY